MTTKTQLMTAEELFAMPDDGYHRYELIRGELNTMAPSSHTHGKQANRVNLRMGTYVADNNLGETYIADTGFVIERNPDTVLAPGTSIVRRERTVGVDDSEVYFPGPPDIAVEVISTHDRLTEITAKVAQYLEAGTLMVIVVNPLNRTVQVHTPSGVISLTEGDTLDGGDVLPGWNMPVADIFE
ncbi:MAG: Uma2 family endonuclease [Chloroflexi bacterium]|nr:Uma2 family endonuclease [Chloroflexota bacterium]